MCSKIDAILRLFFTKLNHKGPHGRFCDAGFQFVFVWLWLIQTKKTCIRLCLRLRRVLGTVLAIHKQAAATAKSLYKDFISKSLNISCLFTGTFSEWIVKANQRNRN